VGAGTAVVAPPKAAYPVCAAKQRAFVAPPARRVQVGRTVAAVVVPRSKLPAQGPTAPRRPARPIRACAAHTARNVEACGSWPLPPFGLHLESHWAERLVTLNLM